MIEHFQLNNDVIPIYAAIRSVAGVPYLFVQYEAPPAQFRMPEQCLPGLCELYNMSADPHQLRSLDENPATQNLIESLSATLAEFKVCVGQACRDLED